VSINVRLPQRATDHDYCSGGCGRMAIAIIEFGESGMTAVERVCAPCGHELSTQLQELNL
jgi:hypothetical protein